MKSFVKKDSLLKSREASLKKNLKKRKKDKIIEEQVISEKAEKEELQIKQTLYNQLYCLKEKFPDNTKNIIIDVDMSLEVLEEKKKLIPSITHVDGTCRIQTLTIQQNKNFYELIKLFYSKTNVPILFNTSFNLGGEPLVETKEDALDTLKRSDINYLYLP